MGVEQYNDVSDELITVAQKFLSVYADDGLALFAEAWIVLAHAHHGARTLTSRVKWNPGRPPESGL